MTNYSDNPAHVRIDYFKGKHGKWSTSATLDMEQLYDQGASPKDAILRAMVRDPGFRNWLAFKEGTIVVLQPFHIRAEPVLIRLPIDLI